MPPASILGVNDDSIVHQQDQIVLFVPGDLCDDGISWFPGGGLTPLPRAGGDAARLFEHFKRHGVDQRALRVKCEDLKMVAVLFAENNVRAAVTVDIPDSDFGVSAILDVGFETGDLAYGGDLVADGDADQSVRSGQEDAGGCGAAEIAGQDFFD